MRETASGGAVGYYTALVTHDMAVLGLFRGGGKDEL